MPGSKDLVVVAQRSVESSVELNAVRQYELEMQFGANERRKLTVHATGFPTLSTVIEGLTTELTTNTLEQAAEYPEIARNSQPVMNSFMFRDTFL